MTHTNTTICVCQACKQTCYPRWVTKGFLGGQKEVCSLCSSADINYYTDAQAAHAAAALLQSKQTASNN